jgi:hypothetical protein
MLLKTAFIKWIDSTYFRIESMDGEEELPLIKPKVLISNGLVVHEDEDCIVITQDIEPDSSFKRLTLSIPKISIIKYAVVTKKLKGF